MCKSDYVRLLCEASINDHTRFTPVGLERPTTRGRPPKYYYPLFEKEKRIESVVRRILPKERKERKKGSRLAHLYGLARGQPKTHKERLAMHPILSATDTYNYALVKQLDEKLKPLSINEYTISDIFQFSEEIQHLQLGESDFLVSYDVTALYSDFSKESLQWELV